MRIAWLGTASLLIEGEEGSILFDPYLRSFSAGLPPFPMDVLPGVGAIFITHPHLDHFADMNAITPRCACPVYVNRRGLFIARLQRFDLSRFRAIRAGDEVRVGSLTVRAYAGRHCFYDRFILRKTIRRAARPECLRAGLMIERQNRQFRIDLRRDVLAYEVIEGEKSVFLLGSANCRRDVAYPGHMDLLVYPYQGRSDMLPYSLRLLSRFSPGRVMLDHFDDAFPPVSARMDCAPFVRAAAKAYPGVEVFTPVERHFYEV